MKLRFVWIGKTRTASIKELIEDYSKRVDRFARVEVVEIRDRDDVGDDAAKIVEKEGEDILSRAGSDPFITALDERGREFNSFEFASFIEKHRLSGTKQLTFIIGGHAGLSETVKRRSGLVLALSRMTLTHEMARVLLLEQVYRAFTIIHDLPYQK